MATKTRDDLFATLRGLSASGYMDATEWAGYPTLRAAVLGLLGEAG